MSDPESFALCLAFPPLTQPEHLEALRSIDSRIEPLVLPTDPGANFMAKPAIEPHEEPPPWGMGVAAERAAILARSDALVALHTPDRLPQLMPRLRWIQGVGAGVEQFAAAGVSRDRVRVTNASGLSSASMAEFVIGRLLQIWKHFRVMDQHQREHAYTRAYGRTLKGSTIGIVGMGSIGSEVAIRTRALGVRVLGMKRSHRPGAVSDIADELFGPDQLHAIAARLFERDPRARRLRAVLGLLD
jgi:phosphoglycerate dehydrogenase-like enzyme